ncbi:DUF7260 family protein [Halosimplex sp. J119]
MSVETHVHGALERARSERDALEAKIDAYERFEQRVRDVSTETARAPAADAATIGGAQRFVGQSSADHCRTVRAAFAETVRPHSVADVDDSEPLVATIHAELGESVAVALAPTTETTFTAEVKRVVLSEAAARGAETAVARHAVEREIDSLRTAASLADDVLAWIERAEETPAGALEFDGLRERHAELETFSERCDEVVRDRQSHLRGTTGRDTDAAVDHEFLAEFLYGDFPVDYPVLSTIASVDETCRERQRTVRDHLTGRA